MVSDFRFFTLIAFRMVDLILKMLKKIFGSHVEKILSRFEVSVDPLFRNGKITFSYPPLKIHNSQPMNLRLLHRVEASQTRVVLSPIFDICCLSDKIAKRVTDIANSLVIVYISFCKQFFWGFLINIARNMSILQYARQCNV